MTIFLLMKIVLIHSVNIATCKTALLITRGTYDAVEHPSPMNSFRYFNVITGAIIEKVEKKLHAKLFRDMGLPETVVTLYGQKDWSINVKFREDKENTKQYHLCENFCRATPVIDIGPKILKTQDFYKIVARGQMEVTSDVKNCVGVC